MAGKVILSFLLITVTAAGFSAYYYYYRRYKFIGNFWGVFVISIIGAVICNYILKDISKFFVEKFDVNILAIFIGIYISIQLFNKVTPQ